MRRFIAIAGTLVLAGLLTPAATAAGDHVTRSLTIAGEVTFWDDYRCRPGSGTSCEGTGTPVELWSPVAPFCGSTPCPRPGVFDWVFEPGSNVAGQHACVGYVSPTTSVASASPTPSCTLSAAGVAADVGLGLGAWCGLADVAQAADDHALVEIGDQTWEFDFSPTTATTLVHVGTVMTFRLKYTDDGPAQPARGHMTVIVAGSQGSCGLAPDFAPATGYDVMVNLAWTDAV